MAYTGPFPLQVGQGGTGDITLALNALLVGESASDIGVTNVGTNGQVLLGATSGPPAFATLTSSGGSITFTPGANTLNMEAGGAAGASTFHTDGANATAAANAITITGGNNIGTSGAGSTVTVNLDGTTNHAVQIGNAGGSLTSVAVGATNTVLLGNTGADPSFGAVPNAALANSSITLNNGANITVTGSPVALGGAATIAVSGVIPIANGGTNASSMATVDGVVYYDGTRLVTTSAGAAGEVLTSNGAGVAPTYQAAGGGGGGIITLTGDGAGGATGATVDFVGGFDGISYFGTYHYAASGSTVQLSFGDSNSNLTLGAQATASLSSGTHNSFYGVGAGEAISTEDSNSFFGYDAGVGATGDNNSAFGSQSGPSISGNNNCVFGATASATGVVDNNCIFGYAALSVGSNSVAIGANAGSAGGLDSDVYINSVGVANESNTLRIGAATGVGTQELNAAFIAGIQGITVTGTAILVSSSDQLGIAVSSKRFKNDIQSMTDESEALYKLRPVTFVVNRDSAPGLKDAPTSRQCGLIAEEVAQVLPQYVSLDKDGAPLSVSYGDLTSLLINEIQKLNARISALEAR